MTSPTETAPDHQTVPENDHNMPELIWSPADAGLNDDPQQIAPAASGHPAEVDVDSSAVEPDIADGPDAEIPEIPGTPVAASVPAADPESAPAAPAAGDNLSPSTPWHEVLAMFVDDPRSSAERAAGLVDDSVELLVASVRVRQQALLSVWQGDDAGTEEMRAAVQNYRTFARRLEDFFRAA